MTREEAVEIARQNAAWDFFEISESNPCDIDHLVSLIQAVAKAEREACAKVCEEIAKPYQAAGASVAIECAEAVRMRSN